MFDAIVRGDFEDVPLAAISIMGLGRRWVSPEILVPRPPARTTAFTIGSISGDPAVVARLHGRVVPPARRDGWA